MHRAALLQLRYQERRTGTEIKQRLRYKLTVKLTTAAKAARTIREELDKAWEFLSAEDEPEEAEDTAEDIAEDIAEEPEADDIPTIQVKPDDSDQAE